MLTGMSAAGWRTMKQGHALGLCLALICVAGGMIALGTSRHDQKAGHKTFDRNGGDAATTTGASMHTRRNFDPLDAEIDSIKSAIKGAEDLIAYIGDGSSKEDGELRSKASQRLELLRAELKVLNRVASRRSVQQQSDEVPHLATGTGHTEQASRSGSMRRTGVAGASAEGISGQLTGVAGGLDSDACVNAETRTMKEIISGGREASGGFFQGGLGGNAHGDWETYGCWRKHACLDALNAAGVDTTGDAICYKFNSAQHSWLLWGLQSSLNLQCSRSEEEEHGELWGFPLTAPRVKYVSNYSFPLAELNRTLTPIAGYDAGVYNFTTIDISDKISIDYKYRGGVLCPDGKIYFVPYDADNIGVYDPSTPGPQGFSTIDISSKISIDWKYETGVLGPDGKIYFVPFRANNIGVYDPSTPGPQGFSTIDISSQISTDQKYRGGVLCPDGKIYFVPSSAPNIGVYDPSTPGPQGFSTIGISGGPDNYRGGVLGPDGKIYFVPSFADNIGVYDPSTPGPQGFSTIDISSKISMDFKYNGAVLAPNGKIYFVPLNQDLCCVGVYDPSTPGPQGFSTIDISSQISGDFYYHGGVLGPDGKMYFVPFDFDIIGVYDPSTPGPQGFSTISLSGQISTNRGFIGGVLGPDGKIYFVPRLADSIGVLELGNQDLAYEVSGVIPAAEAAWSALLSPHVNKY